MGPISGQVAIGRFNSMKSRLISTLVYIFIASLAVGSQTTAIAAIGSVYIDPLLGGKENGITIAPKVAAKDITLSTSQQLKKLLEEKNIVAVLSRDRDVSLTADERVVKGKMRGSSIYLAITVSKASKNCIRFYYPKQKQDASKKNDQNLGGILEGLETQDRERESRRLTESISMSLQKKAPCVEMQGSTNYILKNAHAPVVILDFGISGSASPYVLDSVLMDKIIKAISDGIKEYFAAQSHR